MAYRAFAMQCTKGRPRWLSAGLMKSPRPSANSTRSISPIFVCALEPRQKQLRRQLAQIGYCKCGSYGEVWSGRLCSRTYFALRIHRQARASINYVARSKQLPRAQGATRGHLGGGVTDTSLHRPRNASGNKQLFFNTAKLLPLSSLWESW